MSDNGTQPFGRFFEDFEIGDVTGTGRGEQFRRQMTLGFRC